MEVKLKVKKLVFSAWVVEEVPSSCISNYASSPSGLTFVDGVGSMVGTIDYLVG